MNKNYPHLFQPFYIKGIRFRNRILSAPNAPRSKSSRGAPSKDEIRYFADKASGGAAQVTVGDTAVNPRYMSQPRSAVVSLLDRACWAADTDLALSIKRRGAVASIELSHAGCFANPAFGDGSAPIGPSPMTRPDGIQVQEMDEAAIHAAIEDFARNAEQAQKLGFDMCMIHSGHGWLLSQFLSPLYNHRTDQYGGSFENRARFPLMVFKAVRQRCGDHFLIEARISAEDFCSGGIGVEESIRFARLLEPYIDLLHVSASDHNHPEVWENGPTSHPLVPLGNNVKYAAQFKAAGIKTPIVTVCGIHSPEQAEAAIASGSADFVATARGIIADPELPRKAQQGRSEEIRPCIRCLNCLSQCEVMRCSVNPSLFSSVVPVPAPHPKTVAVIGGGPGGMQAAITAAQCGHRVLLYEQDETLGGMLKTLEQNPLKQQVSAYKDYLIRQVRTCAEVHTGTEFTTAMMDDVQPDHVIVATGAALNMPAIPGIDLPHVLPVTELFPLSDTLGDYIIVIGSGISGCEAALVLAEQGKQVALIDISEKMGIDYDQINLLYNIPIRIRMEKSGRIRFYGNASVSRITPEGIILAQAGSERFLPADSVIYATGVSPNRSLLKELEQTGVPLDPIGDCWKTGKIVDATERGCFAAANI